MHLDEYLKNERVTEADFAAAVSLSQSQVNRIRRGGKTSWETAVAISDATKGKVTPADLGFTMEAAQ